jgi:hypothetical protein
MEFPLNSISKIRKTCLQRKHIGLFVLSDIGDSNMLKYIVQVGSTQVSTLVTCQSWT